MVEPFIGQINIVGFTFPPQGWATCQGQLMNVAQHNALFALIGTVYGGNAQTTFNLPDLQGRTAIGQGQGPGLSPRVTGHTGGTEMVTLTVGQMPAHTHGVGSINVGTTIQGRTSVPGPQRLPSPEGNLLTTANATTQPPTPVNAYAAPSSGNAVNMASEMASTTLHGTVDPAGNSQPMENMQPYLVMTYVIALVGVFPSRN